MSLELSELFDTCLAGGKKGELNALRMIHMLRKCYGTDALENWTLQRIEYTPDDVILHDANGEEYSPGTGEQVQQDGIDIIEQYRFEGKWRTYLYQSKCELLTACLGSYARWDDTLVKHITQRQTSERLPGTGNYFVETHRTREKSNPWYVYYANNYGRLLRKYRANDFVIVDVTPVPKPARLRTKYGNVSAEDRSGDTFITEDFYHLHKGGALVNFTPWPMYGTITESYAKKINYETRTNHEGSGKGWAIPINEYILGADRTRVAAGGWHMRDVTPNKPLMGYCVDNWCWLLDDSPTWQPDGYTLGEACDLLLGVRDAI